MTFIQTEQIALSATELHALDVVRRIGERLAKDAHDPEHRTKGEAIAQACAALDFIPAEVEDPEDIILRRKDLWHANEGDWSIEDLKNHLPVECANLIDRAIEDACDQATDDGYADGYIVGYDEGYCERMEEEADE